MNSSPISSWDGAAACFTIADKPLVLGLIFVLAMAATGGVTGAMMVHEKRSFTRVKKGD